MTALVPRLTALGEAVEAADGRLPANVLDPVRAVLGRADTRLTLGGRHTVVALAGATGSGKSSLFNALAGVELATVGVRRPTTATTQACVFGGEDPDPLLDWLAVPRRHRRPAPDPGLDGLVLLDLPDHDSVERSHRAEVDRLVEVVDLLVWVLDPQKYADAALHERYLAPLAGHAGVMLAALNQADRLAPADLARCVADLQRLLAADCLAGVPVLAVSATTGGGLGELRALIAGRVASRQAAVARLAADVAGATGALGRFCGPPAPDVAGVAGRADVVPALAEAAGVGRVSAAVGAAYRSRAAVAAGWPLLSWTRRLRPDPMRRLRLADRPAGGDGRTSMPAPSAAERARVSSAVRRLTDGLSAELPAPWPDRVRDVATAAEDRLPDALEQAVATTDLGMQRRPRWWAGVGAVQRLLLVVLAVGALWLAAMAAWSYFAFGSLPVPHVGRAPLPTLLLLGALLAGLLLGWAARRFAAVGGRRRARRARRRLEEQVRHTADAALFAPLGAELDGYARFRDAVRRAAG